MSKTTRFMAEYVTANTVIKIAEQRSIKITLQQAHEAWAEHSDDYCAGWLIWRDTDPTSEIMQALTKWQERHGKLPLTYDVCQTCGSRLDESDDGYYCGRCLKSNNKVTNFGAEKTQ